MATDFIYLVDVVSTFKQKIRELSRSIYQAKERRKAALNRRDDRTAAHNSEMIEKWRRDINLVCELARALGINAGDLDIEKDVFVDV